MFSVEVFDIEGKSLGKRDLSERFSKAKVSRHAIKTAVVGILAHKRQGTASTKTRAEVSGSGKKPWKQKGTGRARAGSRTSPVWRGGGITFGPRPHEYRYDINRKTSRLATDSALRVCLKKEKVFVLRDFRMDTPKTKAASQIFKRLNLLGKTLLVVQEMDPSTRLALRNLANVRPMRLSDLNAYDLLTHSNILFTEQAFDKLVLAQEVQS